MKKKKNFNKKCKLKAIKVQIRILTLLGPIKRLFSTEHNANLVTIFMTVFR